MTSDNPRVPARVPVGTAGKDPRFVYKSAKADRRQHPYGDPMGCAMESPRARRAGMPAARPVARPTVWPCARSAGGRAGRRRRPPRRSGAHWAQSSPYRRAASHPLRTAAWRRLLGQPGGV